MESETKCVLGEVIFKEDRCEGNVENWGQKDSEEIVQWINKIIEITMNEIINFIMNYKSSFRYEHTSI